jgi:uncharacterized protein YxjI
MLDRQTLFVKEHVGAFKLTDRYDILDPETQAPLGQAREEPPGWAKLARLLISKQLLPTVVNIYEHDSAAPLFSIHRSFSFLRSKVMIRDSSGQACGYFKSKLFSFGGGFHVYDMQDQKVAEIKGDWKGWDFKMLDTEGGEYGRVTKKWAGLGKEFFTSADNYIISIADDFAGDEGLKMMLIAAGLAIDIVLKEHG